jgi:CheY-like chemotaxis protein
MPAQEAELAGGAGRRVVIVDDDHDIRESLAEVLIECGYEALTASNGRAALELLEREGASVILLDLMMPVMDGWQFREAQLERPALAGIPVIVVSADANVGAKAAAIGADAFLVKPIHIADLLRLLDQLIG